MSDCNCEKIIVKIGKEGLDGNGIVNIVLLSEIGLEKTYRINFTNGTHFDYVVTDGRSIVSIEKTSTQGLVDTYTITLTDGETFSFEVVNGNGIASIVKTKTENLTDTYTISFTDGTSTTFKVNNGNSITGVTKVSTQVLTDTYRIGYSDTGKAPDTFTVVNGRGITAIAKVSSSELQDEYRISYNDGTSSNFTVTNGMPATHSWNGTILTITSASGTSSADLKGEKGDSATIAIGTVTTGAEGSSASVTNRGDEHDAIWDITIPRGNTGNGIQSIALLSTSGLTKTYRVTYTNGTHFDFSVSDGNGIASIEKTATQGNVDTYTITFTDPTAEPFQYTVTNGSDTWGAIVGDIADQTDLQTALDNKAPVIVESASGDIVTIEDGADNMPVESLSVSVEPVQDLHGYDNPWPAGGGKNKFNVADISWNSGILDDNGQPTTSTQSHYTANYTPVEATTAYTLSGTITDTNVQSRIYFYDSSKNWISRTNGFSGTSYTFTTPSGCAFMQVQCALTITAPTNWQLEQGSTATAYAPYSNICPISGWTEATVTRTGVNVWGGEKMLSDIYTQIPNATVDTNAGTIAFTGQQASGKIFTKGGFKPNTQYTFIYKFSNNGASLNTQLTIHYTDGTETSMNAGGASDGNPVTRFTVSTAGKTIDNIGGTYYSGTATIYTKETGILEGVLTESDFVPYSGTTVTIDLGQTVYGGTLDVGTGTLTVTYGTATIASSNVKEVTAASSGIKTARLDGVGQRSNKSSGDCITEVYRNTVDAQSNNAIRCNGSTRFYVYDNRFTDLATAQSLLDGMDVVYEFATPTVITGLTPAIMRTLLGVNNIWADCGAVDVSYRADSKLYVDGQISEAVTAVKRIMTTTTDTMVAPKNLTAGEIVIVGDDLYKATSNIASGATLTVGSNVVKVTLAEWIASLVA